MKDNTQSKSLLKRISTIVVILGILFFTIGIFYQVPDREIPYDYEEYVGGDAYNMIIEASIRGGEIAGTKTSKTIYTIFGVSLISIGGILQIIEKEKRLISKIEEGGEANEI